MNYRYALSWPDSGQMIHRNTVVEDIRPTEVFASRYDYAVSGDVVIGVNFYKELEEDAFLVLFELPISLSRSYDA